MFKKSILLCLFLMLLFPFIGLSVEQYGVLSGTVSDESGVPIPGVGVKIQGPALMGTRTTVTNVDGYYRFAKLNVGQRYVVTFSLENFQEVVRKDVRIELSKETVVSTILKLGEITERIVITGEIPVLDPKSSSTQVNISKEVVETLANDRQYQTIMEMMPGSIPGNNPAMMGADTSDNIYQFDGMESTDPLTKTWSTAMNFDNFEEMQVISQGAPAEYGRGTGAVINVITKSGSNKLHGTVRVNISKTDWNAKPKEVNTNYSDATHYLNETRPAINLGGPIIKDRIWFFGSWERRNKWKPAQWFVNTTEALNRTPTGEGKGYYKGHYTTAKLTMRLGSFSLMGMWSEDPISIPDYYKYRNSPGYADANDMSQNQGGWNLNAEATTTLGANTYFVARFSMKRAELNLQADEQTGIRYYQNGYYWGAGYYDYKTDRNHDQYLINLNHFMDTSFGFHDLKLGIELYDMDILGAVNYFYPGGEMIWYNEIGQERQRYVFDDTDVLKRVRKTAQTLTFFIQDKWEVTKGLTLNLGVRFEGGKWKNHAGEEIINWNMMDMFAPRFGVAYAFGNNKIYANWGKYYDLYAWWVIDNFQPSDFVRYVDVYYGEHYGLPTWTHMGTFYWTAPGGTTTKEAELKPQYMDEFGVGYERLLGSKFSLGVSYMHRVWKQKIEDFDPDGDGAWHFANVADFKTQNENWGKTFRKYDAVILTLKKNLGNDKFQFMANYTWSKLKGFSYTDGEGNYGDDPYKHVNALGYLDGLFDQDSYDVRHQIKFYGSIILPFDINLGINFLWFSGGPYTDYVKMLYEDDGATQHHGLYYDYLVDPRGESGRFPASWHLDLRIEKKFKFKQLFTVSVYADAFNVLNQQNEVRRDSYLGEAHLDGPIGGDYTMEWENPRYGQFSRWYSPMSFFIGAKVEF